MRIALVSPYSWTYPGGVTRHIEALAEQYLAAGHEVRVLSPVDPDDRLDAAPAPRRAAVAAPAARLPRAARAARSASRPTARSRTSPTSVSTVVALRRELERGYDVVHLHEPVAPIPGWDSLMTVDAPLVATFHCYSENVFSNNLANFFGAWRRLNRLHVRIAVSRGRGLDRAALLRRDVPDHPQRRRRARRRRPRRARPRRCTRADPLRIAFIGQAVERKGLPVLLRAFEALREHVPATLHVVGVDAEELAPLMLDTRDVVAHGKCSDEEKRAVLADADVLCAPSLGGESFGMVLTEAFAAGTPVVASDIAGYRDVVDARRQRRARAARRRDRARRGAARPRAGPRAPRRARRRRGRVGAALRLAARRRRGAERLRGRDRAARERARRTPAGAAGPRAGRRRARARAAACRRSSPRSPRRRAGTPRGPARGWRAGWRSARSASSPRRSR